MQKIRIDQILTQKYTKLSRSYIKKLIKTGNLLINGKKTTSPAYIIKEQDKIKFKIPKPKKIKIQPKNIELKIIYEDKNIVIIDKPAGLTVHPSKTNNADTLINALLYHFEGKLSGISGELRPGIVHRLDKDTSGLIIIAKNDQAHRYLSDQFKERKIKKTYIALIAGKLSPKKGKIIAPIYRSKVDRKKMSISQNKKARKAVTNYEVIKYFKNTTLIKAFPETGRTHQIRVHLSSIGYPIVGDKLYGNIKFNSDMEKLGLKRQFLHAAKLNFIPPSKKTVQEFNSELPSELNKILEKII